MTDTIDPVDCSHTGWWPTTGRWRTEPMHPGFAYLDVACTGGCQMATVVGLPVDEVPDGDPVDGE